MMASTIRRIAIGGISGVGGWVSNPFTGAVPSSDRALGVIPMTATSSSGERSAASPIVPTTVPIRSPSWSRGAAAIRAANAGETNASPGPGSRSMPGGTGASSTSGASRTVASRSPWYMS